jgi:flavin prenyltransferase
MRRTGTRHQGHKRVPDAPLVIGISGASGSIYGIRLLELLRAAAIPSCLIMTRSAEVTLAHETSFKLKSVRALADATYTVEDIAAPVASGSFPTRGMIVAPCSIRSLSEIATGVTSNLLTRAADVTLKERRRLVLLVRETPLHAGHLKSMMQASENGAIVYPPVPAFYVRPSSVDALVDQTLGRVLDLFGIELESVQRWGIGVGPRRIYERS